MEEEVLKNGKELARQAFQAKEVFSDEEWTEFIEELKGAITEGVTAARDVVIEMKWDIGDILFQHDAKLSDEVFTRVRREVHVSQQELYRCLAFRKAFPSLKQMWDTVPEGKNISWHKLVNNYIDFKLPRPDPPVQEFTDEWKLVEWWSQLENPGVVHIVAPNSDVVLMVKEAKPKIESRTALQSLYAELCDFYIKRKKWNPVDLARDDYNRIYRGIKQLLEKAHGDRKKVEKAISWCYTRYRDGRVDWTIETVIKKYPEAMR